MSNSKKNKISFIIITLLYFLFTIASLIYGIGIIKANSKFVSKFESIIADPDYDLLEGGYFYSEEDGLCVNGDPIGVYEEPTIIHGIPLFIGNYYNPKTNTIYRTFEENKLLPLAFICAGLELVAYLLYYVLRKKATETIKKERVKLVKIAYLVLELIMIAFTTYILQITIDLNNCPIFIIYGYGLIRALFMFIVPGSVSGSTDNFMMADATSVTHDLNSFGSSGFYR